MSGVTHVYKDGVLVDTVLFAIPQEVVNRDVLRDKAQAAIATNATFLALASPTNAQTLAQVKALTRQTNALIRMQLGALDDISDT